MHVCDSAARSQCKTRLHAFEGAGAQARGKKARNSNALVETAAASKVMQPQHITALPTAHELKQMYMYQLADVQQWQLLEELADVQQWQLLEANLNLRDAQWSVHPGAETSQPTDPDGPGLQLVDLDRVAVEEQLGFYL